MLRHKSDQKTFFDEVVGYYLPDNHFLKVNDIIDWTPIEKRLESLYDLQKRQRKKRKKKQKEATQLLPETSKREGKIRIKAL